ncbi:hypothetical protein F5148DRAFT_989868 [Russula earlei]|uniref:Uncharacterized protein n=1 Tax=Russula earlei TaxID=71964 RepID=A0ACC0TSB0_9AGAM|nr:hypothetical protein F5148DRAFT_989868 [Russula earlei]
MPVRHSGLQKEVLALYRRALRMVRTKPPPSRDKFRLFVRYSFKTQAAAVSPRSVGTVEHLIRRGQRQLETYEHPAVRDCQVSREMRDWEVQERRRWHP